MAEDKYTGEDAREALKKILNLKKEDESSYAQEESSNGEIQENVTQTPEDILDTPIGVRDGVLKSINPNASNGFYYEIYFSGPNTSVYAKLTYGLGFDYTPEGEWEGNVYKVTEEVKVKLQAIKDTLQWIIVGVEEEPVIIPGAATITRGGSQIITHKDHVIIKNKNIEVKVDENWAYINNKKICVEPCGSGGGASSYWIEPRQGFYVVSWEDKIRIYDLYLDRWTNEISIPDVVAIDTYYPWMISTTECIYQISVYDGTLSVTALYPKGTIIENNNIFYNEWDTLLFVNSTLDDENYGTFICRSEIGIGSIYGYPRIFTYKKSGKGTLLIELDNGVQDEIEIPEEPIFGLQGYYTLVSDDRVDIQITVMTTLGGRTYSVSANYNLEIISPLTMTGFYPMSLQRGFDKMIDIGPVLSPDNKLYYFRNTEMQYILLYEGELIDVCPHYTDGSEGGEISILTDTTISILEWNDGNPNWLRDIVLPENNPIAMGLYQYEDGGPR
jgi:hypothetical protein